MAVYECSLPAQLRARVADSAFRKHERYAWKAEVQRRRLEIEKSEASIQVMYTNQQMH